MHQVRFPDLKAANLRGVLKTGAWLIHPVLILFAKVLIDAIPGMKQDVSWTIVNLSYMAVSLGIGRAGSDSSDNRGLFLNVPSCDWSALRVDVSFSPRQTCCRS